MAQKINRLSSKTVGSITKEGRHGDGNGLYLSVTSTGRKWVFIYQMRGRRREMGLGALADIGVPEARKAAREAQALIRAGLDPIEERKVPAGVPTFAQAAELFIRDLAPGWRGAKTEASWRRSLLSHAKKLGPMPIDMITTNDVLGVVRPLWIRLPESGGKLRERIERLLDFARAKGWRKGENPARWRGHLELMLPKRAKLTRGHHRTIPFAMAPEVFLGMNERRGMGALALQFTILTASREAMTLEATWGEIADDLWVIPGRRMKEGVEHRVPLSSTALTILRVLRPAKPKPKDLIFPSRVAGKPLSNSTMDEVLERMKVDATPHGFRSTFRDWVGDETTHPREVAEAALAHAVGTDVERAYRRGDALEKRRKLMQDWDDFLNGVVRS